MGLSKKEPDIASGAKQSPGFVPELGDCFVAFASHIVCTFEIGELKEG